MLPTDPKARKQTPIYSGVLRYFPDAIAAVAACSWQGNNQHNPGQPLHWAREKSTDHHDCIARHLMEAGTVDGDGVRHSAKLAWRALAALQVEIEAAALKPAANVLTLATPCPPPGAVVPVVAEEPRIPPAPDEPE